MADRKGLPVRPALFPRWGWVVAGAAIGLLSLGIGIEQRHTFRRFLAHDGDRMYRSAWLPPEEVRELVERHQIRTVVNLCTEIEDPERLAAERAAVATTDAEFRLIPFPFNDTAHVDHPGVDAFRKLLADPAKYPIWVHCYHGRERTAKALAMYDIEFKGKTAQKSIRDMIHYGYGHTPYVIDFAANYESFLKHAKQAPQASAERDVRR